MISNSYSSFLIQRLNVKLKTRVNLQNYITLHYEVGYYGIPLPFQFLMFFLGNIVIYNHGS